MAASMVLRRFSTLVKGRLCLSHYNFLTRNLTSTNIYESSRFSGFPNQEVVPSESERRDEDTKFSSALISKINQQITSKEHGRFFAVVYLSGQQFKVTNDDIIVVKEEFVPEIGESLQLTKVILVGGSDFTLIGRPLLDPSLAKVNVTVIEKTLSHLITDFLYRKRGGRKRMRLTRHPYTVLRINNISIEGDINKNSNEENNDL